MGKNIYHYHIYILKKYYNNIFAKNLLILKIIMSILNVSDSIKMY